MKANITDATIEIIGDQFEVKDNRFYLNEIDFKVLLAKYKTDIDWFLESRIEDDAFEIVIIYGEDDTFTLEAYNKRGLAIWKSQEIENAYCRNEKFLIGLTVLAVISFIIYIYLNPEVCTQLLQQ
jgi:hypothetical protein